MRRRSSSITVVSRGSARVGVNAHTLAVGRVRTITASKFPTMEPRGGRRRGADHRSPINEHRSTSRRPVIGFGLSLPLALSGRELFPATLAYGAS